VQNYCDNYNIVRITGMYGLNPSRSKGTNFFLSIINQSKTKDVIYMVEDEIITPTYIDQVAENTRVLVEKNIP
jgi:dTDP-4-dehydrorhamnose reductase